MFYSRLNRINKFYYELTLLFRQVAEVIYSPESIALSALANASVPHDGLESVSGAAVVQAVRMSGTQALQSSSPSGAVLHHPVRRSFFMKRRCCTKSE